MPLNAVIGLALCLFLISVRMAKVDTVRAAAYAGFVLLGSLSLLASESLFNLNSLIQVIVFWATWCVVGESGRRDLGKSILSGAVFATIVCALLAIMQTAVSIRLGEFIDPFEGVPKAFILQGYNTTYGVGGSGAWDKANGMVFLEPSFLSLTCALAILLILEEALDTQVRGWLKLMACLILWMGMLCSSALSGLVVAPFLAWSIIRSGKRPIAVAAFLTVLTAVSSASPVVDSFVRRLQENGSNDARLVRPYTQLVPEALEKSPLIGLGPGSADVAASRLTAGAWEQEVTAPTLVKVLYEYGLLGVILLAILVGLAIKCSQFGGVVLGALVIVLLLPTNSLVNPLITPLIGTAIPLSGSERRDASPGPSSQRKMDGWYA